MGRVLLGKTSEVGKRRSLLFAPSVGGRKVVTAVHNALSRRHNPEAARNSAFKYPTPSRVSDLILFKLDNLHL